MTARIHPRPKLHELETSINPMCCTRTEFDVRVNRETIRPFVAGAIRGKWIMAGGGCIFAGGGESIGVGESSRTREAS